MDEINVIITSILSLFLPMSQHTPACSGTYERTHAGMHVRLDTNIRVETHACVRLDTRTQVGEREGGDLTVWRDGL